MPKQKVQFSPHIYQEWGELFSGLDSEQKSEILMGITMYPNYEPKNCTIWSFIKSQLNKQYEEFLERCDKNKQISISYWSKKKSNDTERIPNDTERHPKLELELEQELESKENNKEKTTMSPLFEECWSIYPKRRRESKSKVYPVWCKIIKDNHITEEYMLDSVKRYANSEEVTKDGGQFAKGFIAWLRRGCYSYEYKQASGVIIKKEVDMTTEEYHQKLLKEARPSDEVAFVDGIWQILPF